MAYVLEEFQFPVRSLGQNRSAERLHDLFHRNWLSR